MIFFINHNGFFPLKSKLIMTLCSNHIERRTCCSQFYGCYYNIFIYIQTSYEHLKLGLVDLQPKVRSVLYYLPLVPSSPTCLMCLTSSSALSGCVPSCLCFSHAFLFCVLYVPLFFLHALHAFIFYVPYVLLLFYMPYVSSFFTCLM